MQQLLELGALPINDAWEPEIRASEEVDPNIKGRVGNILRRLLKVRNLTAQVVLEPDT